jgi:hypothetical protein
MALVLLFEELNVSTVNVYETKANVPAVNVPIPEQVIADPRETVNPELLMVRAAIVLPLPVMVPVPLALMVNPVYVPPEAKVSEFTFSAVVEGVPVLPVKFNIPKKPPVVRVGMAPPAVKLKFGALVVVPPVTPQVKVLVIDIVQENPPVPVYVKSVILLIDRTVVAAVPLVKNIVPVPK